MCLVTCQEWVTWQVIGDLVFVGLKEMWHHFIGVDVFNVAMSALTVKFSNGKWTKGHIVNSNFISGVLK